MAEARKHGKAHRKAQSGSKSAGRRSPADDAKRGRGNTSEPKCWLCSRPLSASVVASVLGPGIFEVHQQCYEQAMRS